ncbi:MAG: hypothetical protein H6766_00200 [Candidatus Peribacteria bacterium]|nr:MAG: hypothetical protein H6766_00200 [Candidatus Peribacteria bacterium]
MFDLPYSDGDAIDHDGGFEYAIARDVDAGQVVGMDGSRAIFISQESFVKSGEEIDYGNIF